MSALVPALRRASVLTVLAVLLLGLTVSLASALTAAPSAAAQEDPGASSPGQAQGQAQAQAAGLDTVDDLDEAETLVEILPLSGFLDPPTVAQIRDVLDLAAQEGSTLVVLQLDAPGGVSVDTAELIEAIQSSPVPVAVLVAELGTAPQVSGAAAALWFAADVRAAVLDGEVGPLAPLDLREDGAEVSDAQLESFARDDEDLSGFRDEARTAQTLEADGTADLVVPSLESLLVELDGVEVGGEVLEITGETTGVRFHSLGLVRRLLHAATTAPFIYLLMTVGLGMLLFEAFQPGFGVAGLAGLLTAGISAFGLFVLPVTWWGVALVILGLLLYAVDTAIAGFGPWTLAATAAFAVGSLNFYDADALTLPVWLVVVTTVTVFAFFVFVMTVILRAQAGPEGVAVDELVGRAGIVRSVLNPEGHVYLDGALWRARWTGDTKRAKVGTPVRVHAVDGPVVLVEHFDADADEVTTGDDRGQA